MEIGTLPGFRGLLFVGMPARKRGSCGIDDDHALSLVRRNMIAAFSSSTRKVNDSVR
jgi:hypothetical protein